MLATPWRRLFLAAFWAEPGYSCPAWQIDLYKVEWFVLTVLNEDHYYYYY